MIGEIVMDGMVVVGDAAGLTLNTGLTVRGMDLAVGSAVAAAEAIGTALEPRTPPRRAWPDTGTSCSPPTSART